MRGDQEEGRHAPCVRAVGGSRYDRSHRSEAPAFPVRVPISAGAAGVAISGSAEIADADRNGSSARQSPRPPLQTKEGECGSTPFHTVLFYSIVVNTNSITQINDSKDS